MDKCERLVVISHVWPFPGHAGQQQRVLYKLLAFRRQFHVTFLTFAPQGQIEEVQQQLLALCDDAIVLPSLYHRDAITKIGHRLKGALYMLRTGLKLSNYVIGELELSPERLQPYLEAGRFDCAVFEYWHAAQNIATLQQVGVPCVLDMHDILWQSYRRQLDKRRWLPPALKSRMRRRYRQYEEDVWNDFDALIAINAAELEYVKAELPDKPLFYAPMGVKLDDWPYSWQPEQPPRIAYYGGLGNPYNQRDALRCYERIMPQIWTQRPQTEFWMVGSRPPQRFYEIAEKDPRVHVTGYVKDVQEVLRTMIAVLCPWEGRFGFRSRLVEVMALGVPVVASPDAVYGMCFEHEQGLLLATENGRLAEQTLRLLENELFAEQQSNLARRQVEEKYGFENSYGRLGGELHEWLETREMKQR